MGGRSDFLVHVPPVPCFRRAAPRFRVLTGKAQTPGLPHRFDNLG
jgi:hypothetical protein